MASGSSSPPAALRVVLLDVNGTLTDPGAIGAVWGRPELGDEVLDGAVQLAMVDALVGLSGRSFADHLAAAAQVVAVEAGVDVGRVSDAVSAAAALPARPGASEALGLLGAAGLRVVALTNSGAEAGEKTLRSAGLLGFVDRVLGVDAVGTFKPDPRVYAYALRETGCAEEPGAAALLATHPWDLAGAGAAGLRTAWVRHGVRAWPEVFDEPDVDGPDLAAAAEGLIALVSGTAG
jgi:2-haloacid dehalogenase